MAPLWGESVTEFDNTGYDSKISSHLCSSFYSLTVGFVRIVLPVVVDNIFVRIVLPVVVDNIFEIWSPFFRVPIILASYEEEPILCLKLMLGVIETRCIGTHNDTRLYWVLGNQAQSALHSCALIIYKVTIRVISRYCLAVSSFELIKWLFVILSQHIELPLDFSGPVQPSSCSLLPF
jgi:hypothetical protein